MFYVLVLLLGITAGLRAATPLAAVSIGAYLGWIDLSATWAGFLGNVVVATILGILAIVELVTEAQKRRGVNNFGYLRRFDDLLKIHARDLPGHIAW